MSAIITIFMSDLSTSSSYNKECHIRKSNLAISFQDSKVTDFFQAAGLQIHNTISSLSSLPIFDFSETFHVPLPEKLEIFLTLWSNCAIFYPHSFMLCTCVRWCVFILLCVCFLSLLRYNSSTSSHVTIPSSTPTVAIDTFLLSFYTYLMMWWVNPHTLSHTHSSPPWICCVLLFNPPHTLCIIF